MLDEVSAGESANFYISQSTVVPAPPRSAPPPTPQLEATRPAESTASGLNSTLHRLLAHCGFDRSWVRGEGAWLWDESGRRFLDFYAQYGAVALGHNAPSVVAAAQSALRERVPAMVQPYRALHAEALARELTQLSGLSHCLLSVSGAEVVEAAIKLVRARSGRPLIISAEGSYHGKTLGALAATGQPQYAAGFGPLPAGFVHVPFGDVAALTACLVANAGQVAAVILEPIQGERGVYVPAPGYLRAVRELCTQHDVALILDEVQTGLGRTGRLFAHQHEDITPDVLLLAKALGGGLFPLAALLCAESFWDDGFALRHSSTFANNNVASRIGLAVLKTLCEGTLIDDVAAKGERLQERLNTLPARFPKSVAAVRGRGLLAAIELRPTDPQDGFFLGYFSHQGLLAYAVAALLAERSGVLVLPSLGSANVLRLAPPLNITDDELDLALTAIEAALQLLEARDAATIARAIGATAPRHEPPAKMLRDKRLYLPLPPRTHSPSRPTYAFVLHYLSKEETLYTDPGFARFTPRELARYHEFAAAMPAGVVLRAPRVRSAFGFEADGLIIAVGMLPEQMLRVGRRRVSSEVRRAVDLAYSLGASVVGLGGYTTPYSHRGLDVVGRGPIITTGNTLTAIMAIEALIAVARAQGRSIEAQRVAVVGARGSVGGLCARLLAELSPRSLSLIGSPNSDPRPLEDLAAELAQSGHARPDRIEITTDLKGLEHCDLIVSATGAARPVLDGATIKSGTIICDVARPFDASKTLRARRDLTIIDGGLVALPDSALRFGAGNLLNLPDGVQLACLSETILLALAGATEDCGVGERIGLDTATTIRRLAQQHGFKLAAPSRDGQPILLNREARS